MSSTAWQTRPAPTSPASSSAACGTVAPLDGAGCFRRVLGGGDGASRGGVRPAGHDDRGPAVAADRPHGQGSGEAVAGGRGGGLGAGGKAARECPTPAASPPASCP